MTKEEQILLLLCKQKIDSADREHITSLANDVDWGFTVKLASYHKIDNFIYNNARINSLTTVFPAKTAQYLRTKYYQVSILNSHFKEIIENISALCYRNKITLVKGSSLIYDLYEDLGARYLADVDFMVRKQDRDSVWEALLRGGWNCDNWPGHKSKYHALLSDVEYKTMHYIYYENTSGRYFADIHWKFFCGENDDAVAGEAFDSDRKISGNLFVHSNEMQLIHLCVNNWLDFSNGVIFLRNLCDINELLLCRNIRWNLVEKILKMQSSEPIMRSAVILGLNCIHKLFNADIPIQYQCTILGGEEITPTMLLHCGTTPSKQTLRQSMRNKFRILGSAGNVTGFIFKSIFPDRKWLRGSFHNSKCPLLTYWKYLIQRHVTHSVDRISE